MAPQLIFGTATFGMDMTEFQDPESVKTILKTAQELGIQRLDTGARYPPRNPGRSEELIGETKAFLSDGSSGGFTVDTKIYTNAQTDGSGDLTPEAVGVSITASLKRLQRPEGVNVLYAHRADPSTPLEDQIKAFNQQIKDGRCKAWGVSNVAPEMLEEILRICDEKGLQKPSCYQGDYNLATRGMETRLLPILRAHGMSFNAFRALAAGFLTGRVAENQVAGTRFANDNPLGKAMQSLFGSEKLVAALKQFNQEVSAHDLKPVEVAIRWIVFHSALSEQDGVLLGASRTEQLRDTVGMIRKGPLPTEVLKSTEDFWLAVKDIRGSII
ncbi:Aflatoxin B1 aldehyde reductase member 3 [Talaromyces islandicus]|uniref:Aflatoxin B1 aldehyde reductase member 3 n=1 Tax=Talaromyces islandicus TaxID=28573 RepID=A0A0U1LIQ0_TALIS|nr:Aflatoxin B1 aldehyde reductase member 3 [Talaromyces islandicus]